MSPDGRVYVINDELAYHVESGYVEKEHVTAGVTAVDAKGNMYILADSDTWKLNSAGKLIDSWKIMTSSTPAPSLVECARCIRWIPMKTSILGKLVMAASRRLTHAEM